MHPFPTVPLVAALLQGVVFWGGFSCHAHYGHDDDDIHHPGTVQEVSVRIDGAAGIAFEAFFEDDGGRRSAAGTTPFEALFEDQVGYFVAVVEKESGGNEEICVLVATGPRSEKSCTTVPHGTASVSLAF